MRFIADGVDIPNDLLWAQDEGRVVFFCGAGVSRAKAGLPDFDGLTQGVLDSLHATETDDARKLFEFAKAAQTERGVRLAISDQVFQLLRRSFTDANIYAKVAEALKPRGDVDLGAHRTLLKLARLQSGQTRIVTTNFDLLFEACKPRLASVTRSNLPHLAFNEADWGVVHLHGCVTPDYSGPTRDGFVLSSAAFGDAYLAMGWARDFVREILNRYVAVFVGYSAEDPPIRYLLEGLQQSNGSSKRAYAFQAGPDDQAAVAWDEKGVEALMYPTEKGCGHRRLWEVLDAWAKRNTDPAKWRTRVLTKAQRGPARLRSHERGMIAHIVSSAAGAQAFASHKPAMSAEWLCVFDPLVRYGEPRAEDGRYTEAPKVDPHERYRLDSDPPPRVRNSEFGRHERMPERAWSAFTPNLADLQETGLNHVSSLRGYFARYNPSLPRRMGTLASWIAATADQPAAAWWAGHQDSLHHEILERIRLDRETGSTSEPSNVVVNAWRAIAECHDLQVADRDRIHELRLRVGRTGWHEPAAREYAAHFSPRLKISNMWRRPVPPRAGPSLRVRDLVHIDVEYSRSIRTVDVPDEYLRPLIPKLRAGLELAEDLERRYSYNIDICSIEPDEPRPGGGASHSRQYKLSGHVLLFVRLFRRLATLSPEDARAELATWPRQNVVFERLRVWAMGNLDLVPASALADELLALTSESFWPFRGERDLLLGLARRWDKLDDGARKSIEKRILKGPPRYRRISEADYTARSAHHRLSRINWLAAKGCTFSFNLERMNERLRTRAPDWHPEYASNAADSHDGRGGWVRTETDFSAVENLPAAEVISHIETVERRPRGEFVEFDPFLGLSKEKPEKALLALAVHSGERPFADRFWHTFLRVDAREKDTPAFACAVADEVVKITDDDFAGIARSASDWFEKVGPDLLEQNQKVFDALWQKFVRTFKTNEAANETSLVRQDRVPDWITEAINSAPGNLAELALSINLVPSPEAGQGFPRPWLTRIEELLALPGDARRYALVIVAFQLHWFFHVDPTWTEVNILSVLDDESADEEDQDAIWAGFFWSANTPALELFARLKPHLLEMGRNQTEQGRRDVQILAGITLAGWGSKVEKSGERAVSSDEMRTLLLQSSNEFRQQVLSYLEQWSDGENEWSAQLAEFLEDAWPRQKDVRTPEISARLCELALSQKSLFPEIAALASQLVTKVSNHHRLFIPELRDPEETLAGQHPEAMLGLLYAVLPDAPMDWPYGAAAALRLLGEIQPSLRADLRYIELESRLK